MKLEDIILDTYLYFHHRIGDLIANSTITYNRNTFTPVYDAVTSEGISDPLGMLSEAWNVMLILQQFEINQFL